MIQRLVWYLELTSGEPEQLETMVSFAASQGASLHTVFIENDVLLRCGELPCSREISQLTGRARPLRSEQLARQLHQRREQLEQRLAMLAARHTLNWSWKLARGRRERMLGTAGSDEVAVLMLSAGEPLPAWLAGLQRSLLLLGSRFRPFSRIVVLLDDGNDTELLALGQALAERSKLPFQVQRHVPLRSDLVLARADNPVLTKAGSTAINAVLLLPAQSCADGT
ncbi:hypothetical protein [Oceanimonas baumannii]|uniref:hypothetical protein n=1 Tax=Oceanimonas baumannii TaxID=129578 RepID=UPI003A94F987